jgi:transposase
MLFVTSLFIGFVPLCVGVKNMTKIMRQPLLNPQKSGRLSGFVKRIAYKKGRVAAITATARKLAVIIWNMLTKEELYKKAQVNATVQKAREAGLRQVQRRLVALDLIQDDLMSLFTKASLSVE